MTAEPAEETRRWSGWVKDRNGILRAAPPLQDARTQGWNRACAVVRATRTYRVTDTAADATDAYNARRRAQIRAESQECMDRLADAAGRGLSIKDAAAEVGLSYDQCRKWLDRRVWMGGRDVLDQLIANGPAAVAREARRVSGTPNG